MRRALRAYLVLLGLALAVVLVRAQVTGGSVGAALTGGLLRSLAGGALAASVAFAGLAPLRARGARGGPADARFVAGWVLPGAAFSLGTWITALLTVRPVPSGIDTPGEPVAWLLVGTLGGAAGYALGGLYWAASWTPDPEEGESGHPAVEAAAVTDAEGTGGPRFSRSWGWVALALVGTGIVARQAADRIEEQDRQQMLRTPQEVKKASVDLFLERIIRLRRAAPVGSPAADYARAASRIVGGSYSRWYGPPPTQWLSQIYLDEMIGLEVVFREGRVADYRLVNERPDAPTLSPDSAARLLSLPDSAPIFADVVEWRELPGVP